MDTLSKLQELLHQKQQTCVRDILVMVQELKRDEYDALLKIWERHPRERWERIKALEELENRPLNETKVLMSKRTDLRKAWRNVLYAAKTTK